MEQRRLIQFGNSSCVVSLPKYWLDKYKLKKGDRIFIEEEPGSIRVYPKIEEEKKEENKIVIGTNDKKLSLLSTEIVSAYLTNHDIIEIKGNLLKTKAPEIRSIIRDLTGMEVIEQTSGKIVAKDFFDVREMSMPTMIRRMDVINRSMIGDVIISLATKEDCYDSLFQRDLDINRLVYLSYRVMRQAFLNPRVERILKTNGIELLTDWLVTMHLEKIGDQAKRIARALKNLKIPNSEQRELGNIFKLIEKGYSETMKSYYTRDRELAYKMENENPARINRCNNFLKRNRDESSIKIIENLKAMSSSIKHISRNVITRI